MSQVVLECIVPVFLLPTGSSNQSFKCIFHFDIANLTSGLLVRPQAQVWTGCAGIDSTYLAQILMSDFIRQFKTAHKSKLKHEQQKFEADFDSKNKAFIEAVNNMTIHVHPVLQEVIALFSELDSIPFFPVNVEPDATAFPPVNELLNRSDYRKQLPVEYHTLIDLVLEG